MAALIILVNRDPRASRHLEERLSERGYLVAAVASFSEATTLLKATTPDLLVVDVRLDAYNGLHLAIRTRANHPDVPVIVTHSGADRVAEADARRIGAVFIPAPLDNPTFLPTVRAAVAHRQQTQRPVRRWTRRPVSAAVEASVRAAHAQIMDVSYGGVRLAFDEACELPATFEVSVPSAGVTAHAARVWTRRRSGSESIICGAAFIGGSTDQWHRFVDALVTRDATA